MRTRWHQTHGRRGGEGGLERDDGGVGIGGAGRIGTDNGGSWLSGCRGDCGIASPLVVPRGRGHDRLPHLEAMVRHGAYLGWRHVHGN
jgi:hypothetical protein